MVVSPPDVNTNIVVIIIKLILSVVSESDDRASSVQHLVSELEVITDDLREDVTHEVKVRIVCSSSHSDPDTATPTLLRTVPAPLTNTPLLLCTPQHVGEHGLNIL